MSLLSGKQIIILGGSRGIGFSTVIECLQQGAVVGSTYHSSYEEMLALQEKSKEWEGEFYFTQMDIQNADSVNQAFNQLMEQMDGIDVLINNAGITKDCAFPFMDDENWNSVINANLTGTYRAIHKVLPSMVSRKNGVILNVSSVSGIRGMAGQANYSAAKAGLIGLTKSLSRELGPYNIRVNAIAPGYIQTDMTSHFKQKFLEDAIRQIPLKRFGQPEEVSHLLVFLASDLASYINGQTIVIDGGLT